MKYVNLIPVIVVLFLFTSCNNNTITFESLLKEMTDKAAITYFPEQEYSLKQFSSYDRKSVSPDSIGWWANSDWTQFIREEKNDGRREFVMLDADGPGAVVRFWMTFSGEGASDGTLRIYIDENKTPVIEDNVLSVIDSLAPEPLSASVSPKTNYAQRGHNLYLPIPYSKHCKITYECDAVRFEDNQWKPSIYYNINYRTYKPGVSVKSFTKSDLDQSKPLMEKVSDILLHPKISGNAVYNNSKTLSPDEKISVSLAEKGKAISGIRMKIDAKDRPQALCSTVLKISFNGEETVWVPVGEFFGTGYQLFPSKTWYTKVDSSGRMEASWIMPFRNSANINIINYGTQNVDAALEVYTSKYKWDSSSMHFGTSWHELTGINTASNQNLNNDEWHFDVNYVDLKGEGVYAGDALTIFNTVNTWWGEGDEKIFVDGENFPSCFGTGTEDYYGYAWCRPEKFTHPFIAQPTGAGNWNYAMTINLRYRSLDAIPFKKEINANIELWHWIVTKMNFALTAYWYVKPGFKSNVSPDIESVKRPVALKRTDVIKPLVDKVGKLEGENLEVVSYDSGKYYIKYGFNLSGKVQLFWENGAVGDQLKTRFIVNEAGKYRITAYFSKGVDHGKIRIGLNDKTISGSINCYGKKGDITIPVDLGIHTLKEGENTFSIKIIGADKSAKQGNKAGVDYLKFEKIK